jgi:hypothetical protein
VISNFRRSIETKTVLWLTLDESVHEICRLHRPTKGDLIPFDLYLLCQDVISDLFTCLSYVRSLNNHVNKISYPSHHTLIANYTDCEVVNSHPVILPAHDFWGHVSGRAAGLLRILRVPYSGDPEIRHSQVALIVEY